MAVSGASVTQHEGARRMRRTWNIGDSLPSPLASDLSADRIRTAPCEWQLHRNWEGGSAFSFLVVQERSTR
jgi:hypothetical protein